MPYNCILRLLILSLILSSCKEEVLPKPKAMLRLEYKAGDLEQYSAKTYRFEFNRKAVVEKETESSVTLKYPDMKGSIFLTYKPVKGNLTQLLSDAQKLSYEHVVKADNIIEQPYVNEDERVYGMYYEVKGNAASQAQFYLTDSLHHFVTGSLYFYAKPNYDSIYPAAVYLQKDIRRIMETLRWKEE
ncbi:MAG: gliding motility lipoprotein GldD [Flavobacteriaceae bacterium]